MSENSLFDQLDQLAAEYVRTRPHVGLVVGLSSGEQQFTRSYGASGEGSATPPNANTIFEIGSITKVFTGITLAKFISEGHLGLDDAISRYLPAMLALPPPVQAVTLRQLATHTSGLPRLPPNLDAIMPNPQDNQDNPYVNYAVQDLYDCLSHIALRSEPGTQFAYSNLGMSLLGHILELYAGQPYEHLVRSTICQPLCLSDTTITLSREQELRFITGYAMDGQPISRWDFQVMAPGGAYRSTVHDLLTFIGAHLTRQPKEVQSAFDIAHQRQYRHTAYDVGLAWIIQQRSANHLVHWHNGGTGGYVSFLGMDKQHQTGIVLLSNYGDAGVGNYDLDTIGYTLLEELAQNPL